MTKLAKAFGLSDVGLAKICRKHDIPRPPRGYWAKKLHGQEPARIPLPSPDQEEDIKMRDANEVASLTPSVPDDTKQKIAAEQQPEMRIEVADSIQRFT